ncbi:MAG TPA: helix-turn-helix domain-containing protein [Caulobacteraceae bacterium]|jgi:AcrR family transcriptional regulator|nr:helix-turn-helix domain-containing protein [Caulobacteraceae bacterium]
MDDAAPDLARKPRADSLRNREQLMAAAKAAFTERGADAPLEEIARRAGVGIGTLYRHFPTREALLAAVYRREVQQLSAAADRLLAELPAGEALEAWLHQLVDYMATKRVIAPALQASPGEGSAAYASGASAITGAMHRLASAAIASGDIRGDLTSDDFLRLMSGLSFGYDRPDWAPSARRLIGVLLAGLRAR